MNNIGKYLKNRWQLLTLILAVIVVYFPILGNDFLYFWDDQWVAINSYTEGGINAHNLWNILSSFYHGDIKTIVVQ